VWDWSRVGFTHVLLPLHGHAGAERVQPPRYRPSPDFRSAGQPCSRRRPQEARKLWISEPFAQARRQRSSRARGRQWEVLNRERRACVSESARASSGAAKKHSAVIHSSLPVTVLPRSTSFLDLGAQRSWQRSVPTTQAIPPSPMSTTITTTARLVSRFQRGIGCPAKEAMLNASTVKSSTAEWM
jgi:hypothetical protein